MTTKTKSRAQAKAPAPPVGYELVPVPLDEKAAAAKIDALKGCPKDIHAALRLLLTRQHAVYVVQAEGGDEHAIHRARGVAAALYAIDEAVEKGIAAIERVGFKPPPAMKRKAVSP